MTGGYSMRAITFSFPPQRRQISMSIGYQSPAEAEAELGAQAGSGRGDLGPEQ
jgi:hypothetical protein